MTGKIKPEEWSVTADLCNGITGYNANYYLMTDKLE
jgi:hypothetical protein